MSLHPTLSLSPTETANAIHREKLTSNPRSDFPSQVVTAPGSRNIGSLLCAKDLLHRLLVPEVMPLCQESNLSLVSETTVTRAIAGMEALWAEARNDARITGVILDGPVVRSHPSLSGANLIQLKALVPGIAKRGDECAEQEDTCRWAISICDGKSHELAPMNPLTAGSNA